MRLFIIRHAKAEPQSDTGRDADRPLSERGLRQADWLAERLAGHPHPPSRLLCSPAVRTRQTAHQLAAVLDLAAEPQPELGLDSSASAVLELIARIGGGDQVLALVGHNPTVSGVVSVLCTGAGGDGGADLRTGEAAVLDLPDAADPIGRAILVETLRMPKGHQA